VRKAADLEKQVCATCLLARGAYVPPFGIYAIMARRGAVSEVPVRSS